MASKFEVYQSPKNKEYYFRLKAGNGEIILSSQGYKGKKSATNGIDSVKKNCSDKKCWERKEAKNGKHHFNLKSTNGQIVGSSQMYASKASMENGIKSVVRNAKKADVKDLTEK